MNQEQLIVTKNNLKKYIDAKIDELSKNPDYSPNDVASLRMSCMSFQTIFEGNIELTKNSLERRVNYELDFLIEEQKAETSQKRLSKKTKQLYSDLRKFYNDMRYHFGLKRIRDF